MVWSKVVSIEKLEGETELYNLSCAPYNNYFANNILVHNCYRLTKRLRVRSIKNLVDEMKMLKERFSVTNFFFQDELFIMNKARLKDFKEKLVEAGLKIKYTCSARVDVMDEEIIQLLKDTGCQGINFGFESSSNKVLELMNKNATREQNIQVLELVNRIGGIGMGINFIWNNLGDTKESLWGNVELIKKYNTYLNCRTIRPVTPYPGSPLYYQLINEGKIKGPKHFFELFKNSDLILVNNMNMTLDEAYAELLLVNSDLILDHYLHTKEPIKEAYNYIIQLAELYSGKTNRFRGTRHYNPDEVT